MSRHLLLAAAAVLLANSPAPAAPAPAARPGGPPVLFQTQSVDDLLKTAKAVVTAVAGDGLAGSIDAQIQQKLGEKGFAGLDTTRPLAGYAYLPDQMPKDTEDWKGLSVVLAIPITDEAGFKDFLGRLPIDGDSIKLVPLKGADGLFSVESANHGEPEVPVRLRFVGKTAYVGVNIADELMAADKLLKPDALTDPKETAAFAARVIHGRVPKAWTDGTKQLEEALEKVQQQVGNDPAAASWLGLMTAYMKWTQKLSAQMSAEAAESGYRVRFDPATAEVGFEAYTAPRPGTALAKQTAAWKPAEHRFAGLKGADAAAAMLLQIPMLDDEFRQLLTTGIGEGEKRIDAAPEESRELLKELYAGLRRTVKADRIDLAAVVSGPDKKGHFTAVAAVSFEDALPLEKAVKAYVKKSADAKLKDAFKFDVDTAGGVSLHQVVIPETAPDGVRRVFGSADVYLAFGPKGMYVAMGDRAKEGIAAAVAAAPSAGRPFELSANPKRLGQLVTAAEPNAGGMATQVLGEEDKLTPAMYLSVTGGDRLTYRFAVNLKLVARPLGMTVLGVGR